jgi:hypothetical protein
LAQYLHHYVSTTLDLVVLIFNTCYAYTEWRSVTVIAASRDLPNFYNGEVGVKHAKELAIKIYVAKWLALF